MNKNRNLAPIILFVYNRLDHTKKTLEALKNNELANESELYIYSDAAKTYKMECAVENVRKFLKSIDGFKKVIVIERKTNYGLARSIIEGVNEILSRYKQAIVLEDDLITSKYFLNYMNDALEVFQNDKKIFSITGFSFSNSFMNFSKDYNEDIYLNIRPMSWSWATWIDRWETIDWDVTDYNTFKKSFKKRKEFNRGGSDLTRMLRNQMNGKLDSWYIRWAYSSYKKSKYTVYPKISYVNNIGHDNSGVHCSVDEKNIFSHLELNNNKKLFFNKDIKLDNRIVANFNKAFKVNFFKKLNEKFFVIINDYFKRYNFRKLIVRLRDLYLVKVKWKQYDIGVNFHAGRNVFLWARDFLVIGDNCYIGRYSQIECNCIVGNNVLIANNVALVGRYDHNYQQVGVPMRQASQVQEQDYTWLELNQKTVVGDDVWIGYGSIILSGVSIGTGCIIAAGSVVTKDTDAYGVYAGVPAKKISDRFVSKHDLERHLAILKVENEKK